MYRRYYSVNDMPQIITNNKNGIVVSINNKKELSDSIKLLKDNGS